MEYKIPLFKLHYDEREEEAILEVLRSRWISLGPKTRELEEEFARHIGTAHAVAVSSGTAALFLALQALGIGPGDEVIVPPITFVATANAVRYTGATVVFADILDWEDFSLDPEAAEEVVTERTRAILVVHYGGFVVPLEPFQRLCEKHNLFLIEDAAHATDTTYKEKKAGSWGAAGCFSFYANKILTCAEGGMVTTDSEELAQKVRLLRSHGMTSLSYERAQGKYQSYDVVALGYNYRLDDIRAALLMAQLEKREEERRERSHLRQLYLQELREVEELYLPYQHHTYPATPYIFPILLRDSSVEERETLRQYLAERGIQTSVHYPALHQFSIYAQKGLRLPKSEYVAQCEITLPFYFGLKEEEVRYICAHLREGIHCVRKKS